MNRRQDERFDAKLYVKIRSGSLTAWGLLDDVSERGLFIKSIRGFDVDEKIDLDIFMPDNSVAFLTAVVRRIVELPEPHRRFGVGVEILERGMAYKDLLRLVSGKVKKSVRPEGGVRERQAVH